jgi:glycosyltransferase involved in cell wall biosynthesis
MSKLSVIVPSFNQGIYLEECIRSIISQNFEIEIIIIDNLSNDSTIEVLNKYSSHINYWHSKKDSGQSFAINYGVSISKGDYITWLNADDYFLNYNALHEMLIIADKDNYDVGIEMSMNIDNVSKYENKTGIIIIKR